MMIEIPRHPNYRTNADRLHADDVPCVICGKAVKDQRFMFWTWEGAYLVTEAEVDAINAGASDTGMTPAGDSGGYPIGTGCLKKHPELKPYLMTDEPLSETGEATAIVQALMVKAQETGVVFEPAPIEETDAFEWQTSPTIPCETCERITREAKVKRLPRISAPLDGETLGLVELAESIADGLESGDIVPLGEMESAFLLDVRRFDGLLIYAYQTGKQALAEHLEGLGLVRIERTGIGYVVVKAVRGEGEDD